jgi:DNA-nicking Smr family endonuclease
MARRKKRKNKSTEQKPRKLEPETFNPLKGDLISLGKAVKATNKEPDPPQPPPPKKEPDENQYFLEALSDVSPLSGSKKKITRAPDPDARPAHPAGNDELEGLAHLTDLVSGHGEMDITFTDEYIEGSVPGFSRKLMRQLKKGMFPSQDYIDLHGLTKQEAEERVSDFLLQSYRHGLRCVLIVHGRGLNSENHIPVLKKRLPAWLRRRPINKIVLAFSTARPYDGGAGAVYVLLRSPKP